MSQTTQTKTASLPPGQSTYPPGTGRTYAPPGVLAGGEWGHGRHVGTISKSFMGTICCAGVFLFPLLVLVPVPMLFPCDERDLYKVNGHFYTADGVHIGTRENIRGFVPYRR